MDRMTFSRSDRPLSSRLGVRPGCRLLAMGTPLAATDGWDIVPVTDDAEVVIAACLTVVEILDLVPQAWSARRAGGRLWVAYRKGRRDLTRNDLGRAVEGLGLGLTWFRQVAVDEVWSAIWFKHRSEFRSIHH
jgi:hypothetical protein